jgi:putative ABC transport system permease protein
MIPDTLRSLLLSLFAAMALALSAIGIYGVVSYLVAQRTHELGIRSALGASAASLVTLIVGPGMADAALGLALGCIGAYATTRLLAAFLFGVGPFDLVTFVTMAGVLAGVALVACYVPARRAARVNALDALRAE